MDFFHISLFASILLCTLVAGFLIAFAFVVMPGIKELDDRSFLKAFKEMDAVIQNNHPGFIVIWAGSVLALFAATFFGYTRLEGIDRVLLFASLGVYLLGVQLPTLSINVPLNNRLQKQDLGVMSIAELKDAREQFEPRWVRWNSVRTLLATVTSILLLLLVM